MKRWALVILYLACGAAFAQDIGFYDNTLYRKDDPFVFCTQGQIVPTKCWKPIYPFTGGSAWMNSPWCEPEDPEGLPWSADDYASLEKYEEICGQAGGQSGKWDPKAGPRPEFNPALH